MLLLLGLLLLGATGAFIGLLIAGNTGGPDYQVMVLGNQIATLDSLGIFLAGVALTLVVGVACVMIKVGADRARQHRHLIRSARVSAEQSAGEPGGPVEPIGTGAPGDEVMTTARRPSRHRFHFGH
ncbi:hypothetical protein [Kitasatospora sp. NPDC050463]|uniref:hypothetical protein n=1 Tax=Kitasatospora sp. NPDC050463 TaxID=3155786 RepID=UPI0033DDDA27